MTSSSSPPVASTELPASPESPRDARRFVKGALERLDRSHLAEDAELVLTELVTNAVLHGGGSGVVVVIRPSGDGVRLEVHDERPVLPSPIPHPPSTELTFGRGLAVVEALSRCWGARPTESGKLVWAELEP